MYLPLCILLMTGFTFLSFLHLRRNDRWLIVTEGILTVLGLLLHPLILLLFRLSLRDQTTDFAAWAADSMGTYLQYALPMAGIFFFLTVFCALSSLWEKKYRSALWIRIRTLTVLACSLVLLVLAGFFGVLSATDSVPLEAYIKVLGIAGPLSLRGMYLAEAVREKRFG